MWEQAPSELQLDTGCVHVWKATSALPRETVLRLYNTLAEDERDRAARFHFDSGRDGYIAARGFLRALLGRYLGVNRPDVKLAYTSHGKPVLDRSHASDLNFNLTHSGAVSLIAFTRGARVGVDVERYRENFDGQRIADRFFSEQESARLRAVGEADRVRAFTQQWTRKESFIKAHGDGLSYPLNKFSISENANGELHLDVRGAGEEEAVWRVYDLDVGGDYASAVTVEMESAAIHTFQWNEQ